MSSCNSSIGIIDIGSNSIRFVVFEPPYLGKKPVFNEKVQCGLGQEIQRTGALCSHGVACTLDALSGYKALAHAMEIDQLIIIGTAALRDARDGSSFVQKVKDDLGLEIKVISGEDEARYSGLGVLQSFPAATGIAADLGGGSLELAYIDNGQVSMEMSLPVGVLRTGQADNPRDYVLSHMKDFPEIFQDVTTLYAIGGTWRALATAHANVFDRPGKDGSGLRGYSMDVIELQKYSQSLIEAIPEKLAREYGLEKRRSQLLPSAALIMSCLLEQLSCGQVIISTSGLRDGLLVEYLTKKKLIQK